MVPTPVSLIKSPQPSHAGALAAAIIVLLALIWMVTYGSFALFDAEHFGQFYDAQAASLLAGHWNVPPSAIFPEGFYHDGKAYGYFGFVPALPRMALNSLFPRMAGSWSRSSVILGCAVTLACCYSLLLRARQWVSPLAPWTRTDKIAYGGFMLLAGLGSSLVYLASRAFIYHEAIIWGVALALASYDQLLAYLMNGRWASLLAGCVLAYLSFFSRISSGCGPCLALVLLGLNIICWRAARLPGAFIFRRLTIWSKPPPWGHAMMIGLALVTIVVTYAVVNHAKFGTYFQPAPMQMHEQVTSDPARFARTGGKWMRLGNVPTVAYAYLSPGSISFEREFPWIYLQPSLRLLPGQRIDRWGPFSSVTTSMTVFLALGLIGVVGGCQLHPLRSIRDGAGPCRSGRTAGPSSEPNGRAFGSTGPTRPGSAPDKNRGQLAASSSPVIMFLGPLGAIAPVLAFCYVDNRYLHEFFPFLMIASAFGLHKLLAMRRVRLKIVLLLVFLVVGVVEIYANCAFALVYQRLRVYDRPPGPEIQMRHWQKSIDDFVARFEAPKPG